MAKSDQQPETPTTVVVREVLQPVQVQRLTTINEQNAAQVDAGTLEKAIEVNRIAAQQELKRQIEAQKKKIEGTQQEYATTTAKLLSDIKDRELKRIRGLKDVKDAAKLLSKLFVSKIGAAGLIQSVELASLRIKKTEVDKRTGRYTGVSFWDYFNDEGTRAGLEVTTTFKAQAIAKAADMEDADQDEIDEDYKGRKTITVNGWTQEIELSTVERKALREARDLSARIDVEQAFLEELEARLKKVGDQTEALKAQIYRSQIEKSAGGAEILAMLDANLKATVEGGYTALL